METKNETGQQVQSKDYKNIKVMGRRFLFWGLNVREL